MVDVHARLIPERRRGGRRLGRHVEHDPRSRDYAVDVEVRVHNKRWARHAAIYDQDAPVRFDGKDYPKGLGSCTGNALAGALSTDPFHHRFHEPQAIELYHEATALDAIAGAFPPKDTGSTGLAVCKAAKRRGFIDSYKHAFSLDAALGALMHGPVITGINWYAHMDDVDDAGLVHVGGRLRGGHEICVVGVDTNTETIHFANSWGAGWGDGGYGRMTWQDWNRLLHEEGDVTVPVPPRRS